MPPSRRTLISVSVSHSRCLPPHLGVVASRLVVCGFDFRGDWSAGAARHISCHKLPPSPPSNQPSDAAPPESLILRELHRLRPDPDSRKHEPGLVLPGALNQGPPKVLREQSVHKHHHRGPWPRSS